MEAGAETEPRPLLFKATSIRIQGGHRQRRTRAPGEERLRKSSGAAERAGLNGCATDPDVRPSGEQTVG